MAGGLSSLVVAAALAAAERVTTGTAPWRYELDRTRLQMPASAPMENLKNAHGLQVDGQDGSIYLVYEPKEVYEGLQCLVKFDPEGRQGTGLGPVELCENVPHGLRYEYDEAAGQGYLYHAHNNHVVYKTTTDGEVVWRLNVTSWEHDRPEYWPFKPTEVAVVPGTDFMWVTDGYGSSYVHKFSKSNATYLGASFGGGGTNSTAPLHLNCPHRMMVDESEVDRMIIMDRSNSRFVWVTYEGEYIDHASVDESIVPGLARPCSYKILNGSVSVVPSLGNVQEEHGAIGIYNHTALKAAKKRGAPAVPMSVIAEADLLGKEGRQHPHDSVMLPNGDVVNADWGGHPTPVGPPKGALSYWRRLP